jgi:hypothetical protein
MARTKVDPAALSGAKLEQWYRRTPGQIEEERRRDEEERYETFVGSIAAKVSSGARGHGQIHAVRQPGVRRPPQPWQEAQLRRPARAPIPVPIGPVAVGQRGHCGSEPADEAGFFKGHTPFGSPPWYPTELPPPLDSVEGSLVGPGFWRLSDGTVVRTHEVERIHAWQRDRLAGGDDARPWGKTREVNRLKDGVIPAASQLAKGEHEADPTCHPYGGWELDPGYARYPERAQRYERQITRAPGLDYVVRAPRSKPVKFDGCAVWSPRKELLEAKGPGYAGLLGRAWRSTFGHLMAEALQRQAKRQAGVAAERPIDWHAAEAEARQQFREPFKGVPSVNVLHTPAR